MRPATSAGLAAATKAPTRTPATSAALQRLKDPYSALNPDGLFDAESVLHLQRLAGNSAVTRLLSGELSGGGVSGGGVSGAGLSGAGLSGGAELRPSVEAARRSAGGALPGRVRARAEAATGQDLSAVRVHVDAGSTEALGARAYTAGDHVVLHPEYQGSQSEGVLVHEAVHSAQQRAGRVDGTDIGGGLSVSDPGDRFEREAARISGTRGGGGRAGEAGVAHTPAEHAGETAATAAGGPVAVQRALLDDGDSLRTAQSAVSGIQPTKRSFVGKLKDRIGRFFGRAPKAQVRSTGQVGWASGKLSEAVERATRLRIFLRSAEVGDPGSGRKSIGDEASAELRAIALDLGAMDEQLGSVPEVDAAMKAVESDQVAITAIVNDTASGATPDMNWMQALQAGPMAGALAGAGNEVGRIAGIHAGKQDDPQAAKQTAAEWWRSGSDAAPRQYVIEAFAGTIVPRATATAVDSIKADAGYDEATTHGASNPDPRVMSLARTAMQQVAPVFFPGDSGWVPPRVIQLAAGLLTQAEQQFGRGSMIAEASVIRLIAWIGAQTQVQNATLGALAGGTVGQKAGLEMHRALMEICFRKHANSDQTTYDLGEVFGAQFVTSLMSRVREAQAANTTLVNAQ